jgi:hypothetical protein
VNLAVAPALGDANRLFRRPLFRRQRSGIGAIDADRLVKRGYDLSRNSVPPPGIQA